MKNQFLPTRTNWYPRTVLMIVAFIAMGKSTQNSRLSYLEMDLKAAPCKTHAKNWRKLKAKSNRLPCPHTVQPSCPFIQTCEPTSNGNHLFVFSAISHSQLREQMVESKDEGWDKNRHTSGSYHVHQAHSWLLKTFFMTHSKSIFQQSLAHTSCLTCGRRRDSANVNGQDKNQVRRNKINNCRLFFTSPDSYKLESNPSKGQ